MADADLAEHAMDAVRLAQAARRAAVTIASDPDVRHYSADTIALVLQRTIFAYVGAGSWDAAAVALSTDSELDGVPVEAITAISKAALVHFARALTDSTQQGANPAGQPDNIGPDEATGGA